MDLEKRISVFSALGILINKMSPDEKDNLFFRTENENNWFTPKFIDLALHGISQFLDKKALIEWTNLYNFEENKAKKIGIIPAGNIPMVGFHDILAVLMAGHQAHIKLSSKDTTLMKFLLRELSEISPEMKANIFLYEGTLKDCDAYIATGSTNTSTHFEQYFGRFPNIIRKNRTSVAVLTGNESDEEITKLADDIFLYYGLGCRNVSKIFVPKNYDLTLLLDKWQHFDFIANNHRWINNYDYIRSIYLINQTPFLDNGFACLREEKGFHSPQSVIFYEFYDNLDEIENQIYENRDILQCIVGNFNSNLPLIPFGQAQFPKLNDYADGIDSLNFLLNLNKNLA